MTQYTKKEVEALILAIEGHNYRTIQINTEVDKSKISRMRKKYKDGKLDPFKLIKTFETKTETPPKTKEETTAVIKKTKEANRKPKAQTVKIPELDEVIVYFRKNKDKFPSLVEKTTFEARITGRDKWIIDGVLRIMRTMVGE